MQTAEPVSTIEATERLVKPSTVPIRSQTLNSQPITQPHLNADKGTQVLRLLEYFKDLFDGNRGDWYTDTVDLKKIQILNRLNKNIIRYLVLTKRPFAKS